MQVVVEASSKIKGSRPLSMALNACGWLQVMCPERWQPHVECAVAVVIRVVAGAAAATSFCFSA